MAGAGAAVSGNGTVRPASAFTDKQIAKSVKDGKAVCVYFSDGTTLVGFVCGMDSFHWGLVDLTGRVHLVHKSAPRVSIEDLQLDSVSGEVHEEIESVVAPYRDRVIRDVFHQTEPAR